MQGASKQLKSDKCSLKGCGWGHRVYMRATFHVMGFMEGVFESWVQTNHDRNRGLERRITNIFGKNFM